MNYWLAIGPPDNWEIGLKKGVWAFGPRYGKPWGAIEPGDVMLFYAIVPVKGIIGYGKVTATGQAKAAFWPQEKDAGHVLWPFQVRFETIKVLARKDWEQKRLDLDREGIVFQRALQPLDRRRAEPLVRLLRS